MDKGTSELTYLAVGITVLLVIAVLLIDGHSIFNTKIVEDIEQKNVLY